MRLVAAVGAAVVAALAAWVTLALLPVQEAPLPLPFTSTDASALAEYVSYYSAHPEASEPAPLADGWQLTSTTEALTPDTWLDPDFAYRDGIAIGVAITVMTAAALVARRVDRRR